jgi:L-rhamnose mutarotase
MPIERQGWRLQVRPGGQAEYERRHDELWPEMKESLRQRGFHNFSIFLDATDLFLYAEVDTDAQPPPSAFDVAERWARFMDDLLIREIDPATGRPPLMRRVFYFD